MRISEVINHNPASHRREAVEYPTGVVDSPNQKRLADFEVKLNSMDARTVEHRGYKIRESRIDQLALSQIQSHREVRVAETIPQCDLGRGVFQYDLAQPGSQAGLLSYVQESPWSKNTMNRMSPSHQSLHRDNRVR